MNIGKGRKSQLWVIVGYLSGKSGWFHAGGARPHILLMHEERHGRGHQALRVVFAPIVSPLRSLPSSPTQNSHP
jgi:hypothetical protein